MDADPRDDLLERVCRLEDEAAITRLILTYGPAADAGMASFAGGLWLEDGVYDWDREGDPHEGRDAVTAMLSTDAHQGLTRAGVAHFGGPPLVHLDGDRASALNYSLIMRREEERSYLWRVSAVRWDLQRHEGTWRVRRRTNRLLDASQAGRELFGDSLRELLGAGAS